MSWDGLANINDVEPLAEPDELVLGEIREVLRQHSALDRFGVVLLHSHFDLGPDEVLVETVDAENKTLTIRATPSEDTNPEHLQPTSWRLDSDDGRPRALSYCHRSGDYHMR